MVNILLSVQIHFGPHKQFFNLVNYDHDYNAVSPFSSTSIRPETAEEMSLGRFYLPPPLPQQQIKVCTSALNELRQPGPEVLEDNQGMDYLT